MTKPLAAILSILCCAGCDQPKVSAVEHDATYQGKTVSEWADAALDRDYETSDTALESLCQFRAGDASRSTLEKLSRIAQDPSNRDPVRGAIIAAKHGMKYEEVSRDEVPLLLAVLEHHHQERSRSQAALKAVVALDGAEGVKADVAAGARALRMRGITSEDIDNLAAK